ncbi:MAG: DUF4252 domain-containing protein [Gammaproteobacteria bacterium]|nr:DUF4252 domain-containing protein [Gammaproteobacteria bacterium]
MKIFKNVLAPLFCLSLIPVALAADNDLENHPGYVDFSTLTAIAATEPTVEISLKAPLLKMITNLIRNQDEEAADFISKLMRVTVNVFESDDIDVGQVASSMSVMAEDLDAAGWDRVVRVREDESHVDIYFRLAADADVIYGIAIMVAEPGETVLVNIVGDISTDDISALGRRFQLDELIDLEVADN